MKIFLIGMPGSGKSTLGKELAQHLLIDFVDLDAEIESSERMAISEIFARRGEDHFRLTEARLLREWAGKTQPFVMATGGGAPCFHHGMEVINQNGLSVFLDCPVKDLVERVKTNRERPLLLTSGEEELRKKLDRMRESRLTCYQQAKITLTDPSLDVLVQKIGVRK